MKNKNIGLLVGLAVALVGMASSLANAQGSNLLGMGEKVSVSVDIPVRPPCDRPVPPGHLCP